MNLLRVSHDARLITRLFSIGYLHLQPINYDSPFQISSRKLY